jgi:hypothetical protein
MAALSCLAPAFPLALFAALHVIAWAVCDFALESRMARKTPESSWVFWLNTWLIRETLAPALWAHTAIGNQVSWRGRKLKVMRGGILSLGCGYQQPSN